MEQSPSKRLEDLIRERARLDAELERFQRLFTILFVDIAGSTSFYDQHGDLAGLVMVQKCNDMLFPLVERHGGSVVKTIGDAILARFEDTLGATRCAVEMQRLLADYNVNRLDAEQIHIRVALNVGLGLLKDNDVFGDVVNVASRIESAASPDEICISPSVFERIQHDPQIHCRKKASSVELKGKAQKLDLYEVIWRAGERSGPAPPRPSDEQLALASGLHTNLAALARPETPPPPVPPAVVPTPAKGTQIFGGTATPPPAVETGVAFVLAKLQPDGKLGERYRVDRPGMVLGREQGDLHFPDDRRLSPQHARFTQLGDSLYVEDLNSDAGVFLRLRKPQRLQPGDIILLGRQMFRFQLASSSASTVVQSVDDTTMLGIPASSSITVPPAELVRLLGGQPGQARYPLLAGETVFGRARGTYTFPTDRYLSGSHASIRAAEEGYVLEDQNSTNGSFIRIRKRALVREGDTLLIGQQLLQVLVESP